MFSVLVLEDDVDLNRSLSSFLKTREYSVISCLSAKDALDCMYSDVVDIIISDIMMSGMDGFDFVRTIRQINENVPIIFMTAREDFESKRKGFDSGADDYLVKPINFEELLLRMAALLKRAKIKSDKRLEIGKFVMDLDERSARLGDEDISLTSREFNILYKLLSYPNKTFTRSQLMSEFWGFVTEATLRSVDVYMTRLRSKFDFCDEFDIVTVRGLGYKAIIK